MECVAVRGVAARATYGPTGDRSECLRAAPLGSTCASALWTCGSRWYASTARLVQPQPRLIHHAAGAHVRVARVRADGLHRHEHIRGLQQLPTMLLCVSMDTAD